MTSGSYHEIELTVYLFKSLKLLKWGIFELEWVYFGLAHKDHPSEKFVSEFLNLKKFNIKRGGNPSTTRETGGRSVLLSRLLVTLSLNS